MRRGLRFTAVLLVVLVALTGFKSKSRGSRGHSSGGGCSSSSSHQSGSGSGSTSGGYSDSDDSYSGSGGSRYRDNNRYGSTPTGGGTASASPKEPETTVVTCAGRDKGGDPAATVKVRNRTGSSELYVVQMTFLGKSGGEVTRGSGNVRVPAGQTKTVRVPLDDPLEARNVARCEVESVF
ncbi:hypothetical protein [Streptomyces sp. RTd22]|uniref:hypothetical protein n=1 Tax=Streptomyces sp. RTd22 TaxID=1841249 RepID=UPI001F3AB098|nr:hypothetical protein [Streptomyces sp. RTd22]